MLKFSKSAYTIAKYSETQSYFISPRHGKRQDVSVSYVLSFPIPPWRVWLINYGVDLRPTG